MSREPEVLNLGRAPFAATHARMLQIAEEIRKRELPGKTLLVEHEPVYTAGRATAADDITDDIAPIERGGKITYHGPGQLVVYPIVRLPKRDVRDWLRRLEQLGVAVCEHFGLDATPSVDGTGVFAGGKKVVSIGVAIRHWINLHGLSINVDMDLDAFHRIRPCGLDPEVMSDLTKLTGRTITIDEVAGIVTKHLGALCSGTVPEAPR